MKNSSELSRRALLIGSATLLSVPVLGQVRQGRPKELLGPRGRMMDSAPAIQQAVDRLTAQGGGVLVLRPGEYWIGTPIVLRRDVRFELGGATLRPLLRAKLTHLLTILEDGASLVGGVLDGTGLRNPVAAFAQGLFPGIGVFVSGAPVGVNITECVFQNFPSGPILALPRSGRGPAGLGARNLFVLRCRFIDNQQWSGGETNALCHFHATEDGAQMDCEASGYRWKAFYIGNGLNSQIVRCRTSGGHVGHASHYLGGGTGTQILDSSHAGPGFGFKVFQVTGAVVKGFSGSDCAAGGMLQGCEDFIVDDCTFTDPIGTGLSVDGLHGVRSSGVVEGVTVRRSVQGRGLAQSGIVANPTPGGTIEKLIIRSSVLENCFHGVRVGQGGQLANVQISGNRIIGAGQYGILGFFKSGRIEANNLELAGDGVEAAIFSAGGENQRGGSLDIVENEITSRSGDLIQIGGGFPIRYEVVRVVNNVTRGGQVFVNLRGERNARDRLGELVISNNSAQDLTEAAYRIGLNPHSDTTVRFEANQLMGTGNTPIAGRIVNRASARTLSGVEG